MTEEEERVWDVGGKESGGWAEESVRRVRRAF